jgi:transcriptional regulator with XRE-family HTH domain
VGTKNRLRSLRERQGLSKADLGAILRPEKPFHTRTIYRWEIGENNIPDAYKARLCDLFGVSLDHLMGRDNGGNGDSGQRAAA